MTCKTFTIADLRALLAALCIVCGHAILDSLETHGTLVAALVLGWKRFAHPRLRSVVISSSRGRDIGGLIMCSGNITKTGALRGFLVQTSSAVPSRKSTGSRAKRLTFKRAETFHVSVYNGAVTF